MIARLLSASCGRGCCGWGGGGGVSWNEVFDVKARRSGVTIVQRQKLSCCRSLRRCRAGLNIVRGEIKIWLFFGRVDVTIGHKEGPRDYQWVCQVTHQQHWPWSWQLRTPLLPLYLLVSVFSYVKSLIRCNLDSNLPNLRFNLMTISLDHSSSFEKEIKSAVGLHLGVGLPKSVYSIVPPLKLSSMTFNETISNYNGILIS